MTSREFCYWMQGYFEILDVGNAGLTVAQVDCIRKHLALVFHHEIDPSAGSAEHRAELDAIHADVQKASAMAERAAVKADAASSVVKQRPWDGMARC